MLVCFFTPTGGVGCVPGIYTTPRFPLSTCAGKSCGKLPYLMYNNKRIQEKPQTTGGGGGGSTTFKGIDRGPYDTGITGIFLPLSGDLDVPPPSFALPR